MASKYHLHLKFTPEAELIGVKYFSIETDHGTRPWKVVELGKGQVAANIAWLAVAVRETGQTKQSKPKGDVLDSLSGLRDGVQWFKNLFECKVNDLFLVEKRNKGAVLVAEFSSLVCAKSIRLFVEGDQGEREWAEDQLTTLRTLLEAKIADRPDVGRPSKEKETEVVPQVAPPRITRPLRVHFLLGSETLPYTQNILAGLVDQLKSSADESVRDRLILDDVVRLPDDIEQVEQTARKVGEFVGRHTQSPADYWVCIGSRAVTGLRDAVGELRGCPVPLVAAGVTNPTVLGLPSHEGHQQKIGVIRYGQGQQVYPDILLQHVFKGATEEEVRLAFACDTRVEHETAAKLELENLPLAKGAPPRLEILTFSAYPSVPALWRRCKGRVCWGWYSLEYVMKVLATNEELEKAMFVSTVTNYARDGRTAIAIQPDDAEIGHKAANLLIEDHAAGGKGDTFGRYGVINVKEKFWIHRPSLLRWAEQLNWTPPDSYKDDPLCAKEYLE